MNDLIASVIIPTLNRSGFLLTAVKTILEQATTSKYEVLVMDNGCDSILREQIESLAQTESVPIRYIPVPEPGLHNGRHAGAKNAMGDLLVFVDDDIIAEPGWLNSIIEAFEDPSVALVNGPSIPLYEETPPAWLDSLWTPLADGKRSMGYLSLLDYGDRICPIDPRYVWGLNFSIRKEVLYQLGGFHPDSLPWELRRFRGDGESAVTRKARRLGLNAVYHPGAKVLHRVPKERLQMEYFEKRAFLQGISDSYSVIRGEDEIKIPDFVQQGKNFLDLRKRVRNWFSSFSGTLHSDYDPDKELKSKLYQAYHSGYLSHQQQVNEDPELLAWVKRPDYWEPVNLRNVKES